MSRATGRDDPAFHAKPAAGRQEIALVNPVHRFTATFAPQGQTVVDAGGVRLALSLRGWGYGTSRSALAPVEAVEVAANEVRYRRGHISEWFVNGPAGLQHGFTLASAPSGGGSGPLTVEVATDGMRATETDEKADRLVLTSFLGHQLDYGELRVFDRTGRRLPAWFEVTDRQSVLIRVIDAHARFPLTIDPLLRQARLTAADAKPGERTGAAMDTDATTLVVGAPGAEAVYVYRPSHDAGWARPVQVARLTAVPADTDENLALFGSSVAVAGETIVVGAPGALGGDGAVYVFTRPLGGWVTGTQTATLTTSVAEQATGDLALGAAVDIDENTVVAGAPGADGGQGAAYVFARGESGWVDANETAKLRAQLLRSPLGISVAIDGDTVVSGDGAGYLLVFVRPPDGWVDSTETAHLSDNAVDPSFGASVAISGDTIVGGAPEAGAVHLFVRPDTGWRTAIPTATLTGSATRRLGTSVALDDDATTVAAGAPGTAENSGAVQIFTEPVTGWATTDTETAILTPSEPRPDGLLGQAVAFTSGSSLLAGAPLASSRSASTDIGEGASYLFIEPSTGWADGTETDRLFGVHPDPFGLLGYSVAVAGETIVVGAPGARGGDGAVYVFTRPADGWATGTQTATLTTSMAEQATGDLALGTAVAIDGDTIVAGAPGADDGHGAVYVFARGETEWGNATVTAKLRAQLLRSPLGISVAIDGDTVVSGDGAGYLLVFVRPPDGWVDSTETAHLSDNAVDPSFGASVAISGDTIVGGAPEASAVHLFVRPDTGWRTAAPTATLIAGSPSGRLGTSVALDGGATTVAAGAPGTADDSGAVQVFTEPVTGWATTGSETATFTASGQRPDSRLGHAVAFADDDTVLAGAPQDGGSGSVAVFRSGPFGWVDTTEAELRTAIGAVEGMAFGHALAADQETVAVGAPGYDELVPDQGAVFVFSGRTTPPNPGPGPGPDATFTMTPRSVDFGERLPLADTVATVAVVNTGDVPLPGSPRIDIRPVGITGAFAVLRNGCLVDGLAPGASCVVDVRFTPGQPGQHRAILEVRTGDLVGLVDLTGSVAPQSLATNPAVCRPGCVTSASGTGFPPNRIVTVSQPLPGGRRSTVVLADDAGQFTIPLLILPNSTPGSHIVDAMTVGTQFAAVASILVSPGTASPPDFASRG